jgi:hypothetical protein
MFYFQNLYLTLTPIFSMFQNEKFILCHLYLPLKMGDLFYKLYNFKILELSF